MLSIEHYAILLGNGRDHRIYASFYDAINDLNSQELKEYVVVIRIRHGLDVGGVCKGDEILTR